MPLARTRRCSNDRGERREDCTIFSAKESDSKSRAIFALCLESMLIHCRSAAAIARLNRLLPSDLNSVTSLEKVGLPYHEKPRFDDVGLSASPGLGQTRDYLGAYLVFLGEACCVLEVDLRSTVEDWRAHLED
mmetsp:Transcript_16014/g.32203  ORF Transcript_16014/g.32203 Transcript_16014/m.32203 type:complete len:133 (+) Transcript_16014:2305-2703(+)